MISQEENSRGTKTERKQYTNKSKGSINSHLVYEKSRFSNKIGNS